MKTSWAEQSQSQDFLLFFLIFPHTKFMWCDLPELMWRLTANNVAIKKELYIRAQYDPLTP